MKKSCGTLMIAVLVVFVFGGVVGAQEGDRRGELRGVFVRLAERRVGERGYMGIVVKPFERDGHVTVLVPQEYEGLARSARALQEGDRLEMSFVTEHGEMWIDRIEAVRRRVEGEGRPEVGKRIEIRREEVRRGPERMEERREGERRLEVRREMRREGEPREDRREGERRIVIRREGERDPDVHRDERPRREPPPHEQLERHLRDAFARHMEHLGMELREILMSHIGRMQEEIQELRMHAEHMRREIEELRHENEMLQRRLRGTNEPPRERDGEAWERREVNRRREEIERHERDMQREREHEERMELERREIRKRNERSDRNPDEAGEPDSSD